VYGECDNFHVFTAGHSGAIVDLQFSTDGHLIYTASTDKTVGIFDVATGERVKRLKGHTGYVNSANPARRGTPLIVSGSDDCSIKVWDQRHRGAINSLNSTYQVTAVAFNDTAEQIVRLFL
jgi:Prp8 binding protein